MELATTTKSGTKVTLKGLPCDDISITIPQGVFIGYWGKLSGTEGFVCRGSINGKDTQICAQIPRADWNNFMAGIEAELLQNVAGLKELTNAINEDIDYTKKFDEMMEDEQNDGVNPPTLPKVKVSDVAALYPIAAAYLKAEKFEYSNNFMKSSFGKKAKTIIAQGGDYVKAILDMESGWTDYCVNSVD